MGKPRFRIASLLVAIMVLGVGFAALRASNDLWDSGVFTVSLAVMLFAILLSVHHTESGRSFWMGFALFGWVYLGLSLAPSIESRLITTKGLDFLDSKVKLAPRPSAIAGQAWGDVRYFPNLGPIEISSQIHHISSVGDGNAAAGTFDAREFLWGRSGTSENFVRIGHSLLTLFVAWIGGQLSGYLYVKERRRRAERVPPPLSASNVPGA